MNKKFFMPHTQIDVCSVVSVVIADREVDPTIPIRVIINKNYVFAGDDALCAIDSLLACGYYSEAEHKLVKEHLYILFEKERGDLDEQNKDETR